MTNFIHKASGVSPSGQPWSFGMKSTGSLTEVAAQASWNTRVSAFFSTVAVGLLYKTTSVLTATSTSTASPTWRQTTKTSNIVNVAGTAITQEVPEQDSMVFSLLTAQANKGGHGRMFFPAPVAAALLPNSGGEMSATTVVTMAAALAAMRIGLISDGVQPVLVNLRATLANPVPYTMRNVTAGRLLPILGTQRRRGRKRSRVYTAA